jgi:hypothetical protein
MSSDLAAPPPAPFKNRRGWLIAFGVVEIVIAGCFLLFIPLILISLSIANRQQQPEQPFGPAAIVAMSVVIYGGLAALFLTAGIGSIKCKNWARITMLVVSGFWLFTGILSSLFIAFLFPKIMEQQGKVPVQAQQGVFAVLIVFMVVLMVALPTVFLAFYSLKSVKATCLASGAGQDAIALTAEHAAAQAPISVILLSVWECLGALGVLGLLTVKAAVVFGIVVPGLGAVLLMTAHAALSVLAAWLIYRRDFVGWTISLVKNLFWIASWLVTLSRRDLVELYREMGFTEQQLQSFYQLPHLQSMVTVLSFVGFAAYLILILYTKKYFSRADRA